MEIPKAYDPRVAEENHYQRWETKGFFAPEINKNADAPKYSIVIPPPNVTGSLHMGHALQHTLMDVLTRWKRMQGYRTLWLPGTDHAGISVQRKVVEQLKKVDHKTPLDIGREEFVRRAWAWKEEYGNTITEQMRREGASVDWSRQRFTMDESLSIAVRNVFCTLYDEGWIYRGLRIVNWCPKDKTVLSDLEVKEETRKDGKLYYLRYPVSGFESRLQAASEPVWPALAGGKAPDDKSTTELVATPPPAYAGGTDFVVVATTRPETMLGDTAVAVNPKDERYKDLIGKTISLPLTDREIPIVADEYVDAEFGTGAVKITPAHDPNDYLVGERHNLEQLLIMNDDGTMNAAAGKDFEGTDRFEARKKVIERFEELGLLEKIEDYEITLPVCERCKTIVEPILSKQWFVKMDEMRDMALDLMRTEGVPHFSPQVPHEKVYTAWLENLKDWTISRQLWWGHQIPAWYDAEGNVFVAHSLEEAEKKSGKVGLIQDQDVLDTWFSSGLWAFSTFGWTGERGGDTLVPMSAKHEDSLAGGTVDGRSGDTPVPMSAKHEDSLAGGTVDGRSGDTPVPMSAKHEDSLAGGTGDGRSGDNPVPMSAKHEDGLAGGTGDGDKSVPSPPDLETFLPTDVLVTGRDIIFLWVSRMIMLTKKFVGKKAFEDVVITGTVLGKDGKPMSKSRNNGVDPLEMFDKFGVDATRIYLASIATGADIRWNDTGVETYRNFANKIWNATRFCLMNSDGASVIVSDARSVPPASAGGKVFDHDHPELNETSTGNIPPPAHAGGTDLSDRWIISRLNKTSVAVNKALETYQFHEAVQLLYHFFWDDFCDWYIELKKDEITGKSDGFTRSGGGTAEAVTLTRSRILSILEQALRLLHPFMPYLTEELWQKLPGVSNGLHNAAYSTAEQTIMLADFPQGNPALIDEAAEAEMNAVIEVISKVRNIRSEMSISPAIKFTVHLAAEPAKQDIFRANEAQILKLARADKIVLGETLDVPKASAKAVTAAAEIAVPLEGLIDFDKERARLQNQIDKLNTEHERLSGQLSNASFTEKAPPEKVAELRERKTEIESQVKTLNQNLEALN